MNSLRANNGLRPALIDQTVMLAVAFKQAWPTLRCVRSWTDVRFPAGDVIDRFPQIIIPCSVLISTEIHRSDFSKIVRRPGWKEESSVFRCFLLWRARSLLTTKKLEWLVCLHSIQRPTRLKHIERLLAEKLVQSLVVFSPSGQVIQQ